MDRPDLVRDTLCVNKLYDRAFLEEHGLRFPDGRFVYEDFVFTARVLAAAPRIAVTGDLVYVWHVRRSAARKSISLDRKDVGNWRARVEAHRAAARILADASPELGSACQVKFLEYDLRMYLRELGKDPEYQAAWWTLTRAYLDTFAEADIEAASAHARWIVRVLRATETPPADIERLTRLAAEPPRLLPRTRSARPAAPVWSEELPVELDGLSGLPVAELPLTVDAEPAGRDAVRLRVHDLYGRLAEAGPRTVQLRFTPRAGGEPVLTRPVDLRPDPRGGWTAVLPFRLADLAATGHAAGTAQDAGLEHRGGRAVRRREPGVHLPAPRGRTAPPPGAAQQPVRCSAGAALPDGGGRPRAAPRAGRRGRADPRAQSPPPGPGRPRGGLRAPGPPLTPLRFRYRSRTGPRSYT